MSTVLEDPKRRTVPRWRSWRDAVRLGDADPAKIKRELRDFDNLNLKKARRDWEAHRSLPFAADLMGAAYASGNRHMARDAAQFLLAVKPNTNRAVRNLAYLVLHDEPVGNTPADPPSVDVTERHRRIHKLRLSLHQCPRNPLAHMDLAREYVALGQVTPAIRAVETALALAPNSRFVLRSASRFFLHLNEPDKAHNILRRADCVKKDPWVLAAEIAVASAADRTSNLVKIGRGMIESQDFAPFQVSELASAIGTLVSESGNLRYGKRLLREALVEPTENVVAQAGWISRHIGDLQLDPNILNTPGSYEARTWANLVESRWDESVTEAKFWLRDEPFATRPAVFGSWAAISMIGDFKLAERFAKHGLLVEPNEPLLLNNLAVSLIYQDRTANAINVFNKITRRNMGTLHRPTFLATSGLIQFRLGFPDEGRKLYSRAFIEAKENGDMREAVWVLIYFAKEELRFDPVQADSLLRAAAENLHQLSKVELIVASRLLERAVQEANMSLS